VECVRVCMFQHDFGTPGVISTKLGTHMAIYKIESIYIYKNIKINVCVCVYVCSSITLEHLEQFQPNLVHI
jgi:hypothetical protein